MTEGKVEGQRERKRGKGGREAERECVCVNEQERHATNVKARLTVDRQLHSNIGYSAHSRALDRRKSGRSLI